MTSSSFLLALAPLQAAGCLALSAWAAETSPSPSAVTLKDDGSKVTVTIGGKLFTEYHYRDVPRPYFYPVIGPGGLPMTRNWPMKDVPNEAHDHRHHKSLWFTHGKVNGVDFWSDGEDKGKIVHEKFTALEPGAKSGLINTQDKWVSAEGKVVLTDDRTHRITPLADGVLLDFDVTIHASEGEVTFGDTKEGSLAIRLAETMRLVQPKGQPAYGHILNSAGQRDGATWGKRADWCEYHGPVQGQLVGVAIFDHPQNPRHPTWWHVRDYGLFAVNPFGVRDFEGKSARPGDLTIPAGKSVTFRYRFYFHRGDEKDADVAGRYQQYAREKITD